MSRSTSYLFDESTPPPPRRLLKAFIVLLVLLVLAAILAVAAELLARDLAASAVRQRIGDVIGGEQGERAEVDFGDGVFLLQALEGEIDRVDVRADSVEYAQLTGDVVLTARGVPLDDAGTVDSLVARIEVDEADLGSLAGALSGVPLGTIELQEPLVVAGGSLDVLGVSLPFGLGLQPSAAEGRLLFQPSTLQFNGAEVSVDALRAQLGPIADALFAQQAVCVAENLPAALVLESAVVEGDRLVIGFRGADVPLSGAALGERGVCAG